MHTRQLKPKHPANRSLNGSKSIAAATAARSKCPVPFRLRWHESAYSTDRGQGTEAPGRSASQPESHGESGGTVPTQSKRSPSPRFATTRISNTTSRVSRSAMITLRITPPNMSSQSFRPTRPAAPAISSSFSPIDRVCASESEFVLRTNSLICRNCSTICACSSDVNRVFSSPSWPRPGRIPCALRSSAQRSGVSKSSLTSWAHRRTFSRAADQEKASYGHEISLCPTTYLPA